jgi:hypothetical protein
VSRNAAVELTKLQGLTFIGRHQTATLFISTVDLDFQPKRLQQKVALSLFVAEFAHIELNVMLLPSSQNTTNLAC